MKSMMDKLRMIVGITGATGIVYGIRLLQALRRLEIESHLVVRTRATSLGPNETDLSAKELRDLADKSYPIQYVGAPISSGSFRTMGMIIAPAPFAACRRSQTASQEICLHGPPTWF
jgi:4-hydroxy-3-polyprenylbenzoate decarboxylase